MKSLFKIIVDWEWFVLLLILPGVLFLNEYGFLLLVIPVLFIIFRKIAYGDFFPHTPFNLVVFAFLALIGLSILVIFDDTISWPKITNLIFGVFLFFAGVDFARNRSRGIWVILAITLTLGVAIALIGILGSTWQPPFEFLNSVMRLVPGATGLIPGAIGGIINPNELAGTLCWVAPLMIATLIGNSGRLWRRNRFVLLLVTLGTIITAFVLLATLSRGGVLGFIIGVTLIVGMFIQPRWRLVLAVGLLVAGLAVFMNYQNPLITGKSVTDPIGIESRFEIWNRAILVVSDFPLSGVSVNGFRRVVEALYPLFKTPSGIDIAHSHNHILQAALDLGIPGLITYLALWLISGSLLYRTWKYLVKIKEIHHPYYALVAGLSGSLIAGFTFGIFDAIALGSRPAFIWWLLLSMTAASHYAVCYADQSLRRRRRRHSTRSLVENETTNPQPEVSSSIKSEAFSQGGAS